MPSAFENPADSKPAAIVLRATLLMKGSTHPIHGACHAAAVDADAFYQPFESCYKQQVRSHTIQQPGTMPDPRALSKSWVRTSVAHTAETYDISCVPHSFMPTVQ